MTSNTSHIPSWPADFSPKSNPDAAQPRVFLIVLDAVGCGQSNPCRDYDDPEANTLTSVLDSSEYDYPNLSALGLGNVLDHPKLSKTDSPLASIGIMSSASAGKDTTAGHWELAGHLKTQAFPTYPIGFPEDLMARFVEMTGRGYLGNCVASGTAIIEELGDEHLNTGKLIVYTSADSVFQIAAHEDLVTLDELYEICEKTRNELLVGEHAVGRVIARPFRGSKEEGFCRTAHRHDYSLKPKAYGNKPATILEALVAAGREVVSVGKISDIFAAQGISKSLPTQSNHEGMERLSALAQESEAALIFANLVDFDMVYGHRRDREGFARALHEFDTWLGSFIGSLRENDLLLITADHGCDPLFVGTDHTDEDVFLIAYAKHLPARRLSENLPFPSFYQVAHVISSWLNEPFSPSHDEIDIPALLKNEARLGLIASALHASSETSHFYLVGGALRDLIAGREITDIDFAFSGSYDQSMRSFAKLEGMRILKTNPEFGTARLSYKGYEFDLANFRKEQYDERSAYPLSDELELDVALEEDAKRRDFSLNALYLDLEDATLYDFYGGVVDLFSSTLRSLSEQSFTEDPSRIIRGLQFMKRFKLRFDHETARQAEEVLGATPLIKKLAAHRREELQALLSSIE